jgi:NodT family efflux transporter outer membrane factor (OMF) lipoprotein
MKSLMTRSVPARLRLPAIAGLLLLSGCATLPAPDTANVVAQPPAWSEPAQAGAVQAGWLATFNDAVLVQLVDESLAHNHDLRAAAARVDEAQAEAHKASAALIPMVGVNVGAQRASDGESVTRSDAGVSLAIAWELDVWGRVRSGAAAGSAGLAAASGDYADARLSLAAQTAKAWFQAIEAGQQHALAQRSQDNLREMLRIVNVRQREGMASGLDTHLVQTDLDVAGARVQETNQARLDALRSLELLLGRYPAAELSVRSELPAVPAAAPSGQPADLLERRPDLRAAEARVAAAFSLAKQARAARLPRISLTGAAGTASTALQSLVLPLDSFWYIGLNLFQPLVDGGRLRADVDIADAKQRAALEQYAGKLLNAFSEVEHSLGAEVSLHARSEDLRAATTQAEQAYTLSMRRYEEGEADLLDALQLHQRLLEIQQALYRVALLQLTERINLHLALGGDFQNAE